MKKTIKIQKVDFFEKYFQKTIEKKLNKYYELEYSNQPDFLFYSVYGTGREHYKFHDCVKIFWSAEGVIPDFNECDYAIGSYPMDVGTRYFQFPYQGVPQTVQDRGKFSNIDLSTRKFCNFIYSNADNGRGAVLRQEFCKKLMQYKHVDCPGKVLNNMVNAIEPREGNWYQGKMDFLKDYKFTIAFENVSMPGMTTEKLAQAFEVGTIPIYWGDPLVTDVFNRDAFINCNDYKDWGEVIDKIKELDNDDEKYMKMLLTSPVLASFEFNSIEKLEKFLCDVIERGNTPFEKDPLGWDAGIAAAEQLEKMQNNLCYKIYSLQQKGKSGLRKIYNKCSKD